jgi:hypothetical protein
MKMVPEPSIGGIEPFFFFRRSKKQELSAYSILYFITVNASIDKIIDCLDITLRNIFLFDNNFWRLYSASVLR